MEQTIDIQELVQDQHNFNKGTAEGEKLMQKSLTELGAGRSILIDKDGNIIAGNKTQKAAIAAGIQKVRVIESDGSELIAVKRTDLSIDSKKGRELALADNVTTQVNLAWDAVELDTIAAQEGIDLPDWGLDPKDLGIAQEQEPQEAKEDDFDEEKDPVATICQEGDVWQLGEHRLMCGDSTKAEDVARLMDGEKAQLALTDPPYGISVVNKEGTIGKENLCAAGVYSPVIGDDTTDTAEQSYKILCSVAERLIIWGGNYFTKFLPFSDGWIIWDKRNDSGIRNNFADGEMAWCSFHTPVRIYHQLWAGMIKEGEHEKRVHPTQKPVRMLSEILRDFSKEGSNIIDLFGGSGSTLIACEQLHRKARLMELDPHYCDVIIARWEKLTGQKAIKL